MKGIAIENRFLLAIAPQNKAKLPMAEKLGIVINKRLNTANMIIKNRIRFDLLFMICFVANIVLNYELRIKN